MANLSVSKYCGSGQKRRVVPVFDFGTSPTTSSLDTRRPPAKLTLYSLPPRRTQHSRCLDSALTTETPTPCRPPENLYEPSVNFPPACSRVRMSSTPLTFSFG